MNRISTRLVWVAALSAAALVGCTQPPAAAPAPAPAAPLEAKPDYSRVKAPLARYAERDCPAMLLRAEGEPDGYHWELREPSAEPVFGVPCRVVVSHRMEAPEGALVYLTVPACKAPGKEALFAEAVRYWFVAGGKGNAPLRRLSADKSVYAASALHAQGFDAAGMLHPDADELRGDWARMADAVSRELWK